MQDELATFTLLAGTVCKRGGIPFELAADTLIVCHPDNWPLIQEGFVPSISTDGQTWLRSQSLHSLDKPIEPQADGCSITTSSSSLPSKSVFNKSLT